jgi:hypothetical protein
MRAGKSSPTIQVPSLTVAAAGGGGGAAGAAGFTSTVFVTVTVETTGYGLGLKLTTCLVVDPAEPTATPPRQETKTSPAPPRSASSSGTERRGLGWPPAGGAAPGR